MNKSSSTKIIALFSLFVFAIAFSFQNTSWAGKDPTAKVNQLSEATKKEANQQYNSQGAEANISNLGAVMNAAESAGSASNGQTGGALTNVAMSGMMAAMGYQFAQTAATCSAPGCSIAPGAMAAFSFLQAGLGMMQSFNQKKTAKANKNAGNDFRTFGDGSIDINNNTQKPAADGAQDQGPNVADTKGFGSNTNDPLANLTPEDRKVLDQMKASGYKVDFDKQIFTTPNGNSISMKDASNASAVESQLNLPAGTYDKGMALVEEVMQRKGFTGGNDSISIGSSVGGGNNYENQNSENDSFGNKAGNKNNDLNKRMPASALVAGLTSNYNGENIGVAADDIFMMVTRRYHLKHEQDSFITAEHPVKGVLSSQSPPPPTPKK